MHGAVDDQKVSNLENGNFFTRLTTTANAGIDLRSNDAKIRRCPAKTTTGVDFVITKMKPETTRAVLSFKVGEFGANSTVESLR